MCDVEFAKLCICYKYCVHSLLFWFVLVCFVFYYIQGHCEKCTDTATKAISHKIRTVPVATGDDAVVKTTACTTQPAATHRMSFREKKRDKRRREKWEKQA